MNIEELGTQIEGLSALIQSRIPEPKRPEAIELGQFIRESLDAKFKEGCRDSYLKQLKSSWGLFRAHAGPCKLVHTLTAKNVEDWLSAKPRALRTRRNYLVDARTLFNEAERRGFVLENVADRIPKPRVDDSEIGILTYKQTWRVLWEAYRLGIGQYVGVMLFAGLRPAEADKLNRDDLKARYIVVEPGKSKTRRRRIVPILPALRQWLDFCGSCAWPPVNRHEKLKLVHQVVSHWPHDALRNCFVSYGLPEFGAHKISRWAGHSEAVLFKSYAELVTDEEAEHFWNMTCHFRPKAVRKSNLQLELPFAYEALPEPAMLKAA